MEAAAQMEARGLELSLRWAPREVNAEADDLSNFKFGGFDPNLRLHINLADMKFKVLHDLQHGALLFHREVMRAKGPRGNSQRTRKMRPQDRLRVSDPW